MRARLGGEERIVDAVQCSGAMPWPVSATSTWTRRALAPGAHFERAAGCHGVAGVEEQIQEDLLQFAGVAVNRRQRRHRDRS